MHSAKISTALAVVLGLLPVSVWAQPVPGCCRGAKYNPATEASLAGSIESVNEHPGPSGGSGVHFMLKAGAETFEVHVGPSWFLADKQFTLKQGDQVEVTGSKVKIQGNDALLAREIKKGDQTLTVRNAQGVPQWSRRRGRL